jgi:hypothetical protein
MTARLLLLTTVLLGARATPGRGGDALPPLAPGDLEHLLATVKPPQGESPWRAIPWLTNVSEARRQAVAQDKPLVIFTAADGSPLSRT